MDGVIIKKGNAAAAPDTNWSIVHALYKDANGVVWTIIQTDAGVPSAFASSEKYNATVDNPVSLHAVIKDDEEGLIKQIDEYAARRKDKKWMVPALILGSIVVGAMILNDKKK
jgi:hypothetical protein